MTNPLAPQRGVQLGVVLRARNSVSLQRVYVMSENAFLSRSSRLGVVASLPVLSALDSAFLQNSLYELNT